VRQGASLAMNAIAGHAHAAGAGGASGAVLDLDLSQIKIEGAEAEAMSQQLAALSADHRGDQLQRLERGLLRLERINVQTLAMMQQLVAGLKKPEGGSK
jgi:general secretion pathway protein A